MNRRGPGAPGSFEREWRRRFAIFAGDATAEHEVSGWSAAGLRRRVLAFERLLAAQELPARARVLDLGSGAGTYVRLLGARGHEVVGADYSMPSLRRAAAAGGAGPGRYVGADAYALPFPDSVFHLVCMVGILQALSEPERAFGEARRVLRPGGCLILEFLNADDVVVRVRSALDRLRRAAPGARTFRRAWIEKHLRAAGLRPTRSAPVFLPPRRLPWLEPAVEHRAARLLLGLPGLSGLLAAAYLVASRREAG